MRLRCVMFTGSHLLITLAAEISLYTIVLPIDRSDNVRCVPNGIFVKFSNGLRNRRTVAFVIENHAYLLGVLSSRDTQPVGNHYIKHRLIDRKHRNYYLLLSIGFQPFQGLAMRTNLICRLNFPLAFLYRTNPQTRNAFIIEFLILLGLFVYIGTVHIIMYKYSIKCN